MVDGAAPEKRCAERYRGFESHPLRQQDVAIQKDVGHGPRRTGRGAGVAEQARLEIVYTVRYRGFESHPLRHVFSRTVASYPGM